MGVLMVRFLQIRTVNCKELYAKGLINDLKEAATCEVRTVCRLSCCHCPYALENINIEKVNVKGLSTYTLILEKIENEQLLISLTAQNLDSWLLKNNLSSINPKAISEQENKLGRSRSKLALVNHNGKPTQKVS
jgi:hypothetical protein